MELCTCFEVFISWVTYTAKLLVITNILLLGLDHLAA